MKLLSYACAAALAAMVGPGAAAADYPEKPVTLVVNFGPGSTTDIVSRLLADRASAELGVPVVVVNKAGAGGTIGIAEVAKSNPDGYTIGTANMPALAILPQMRPVHYDPESDLVQIASVLPYEYMILARADAPYGTWEEFVQYARDHPGEVRYGGLGVGTTDHLAMIRMARDDDFEFTYIPYTGSTDLVAALLGGHIDAINSTAGPVAAPIEAGELQPLLVTSERSLASIAPGVPTSREAGFDHAQVSYMSIVAPAGISPEIRQELAAAFRTAATDPAVVEKTQQINLNVDYIPGKEYEAMLESLRESFAPLLKELGLLEGN